MEPEIVATPAAPKPAAKKSAPKKKAKAKTVSPRAVLASPEAQAIIAKAVEAATAKALAELSEKLAVAREAAGTEPHRDDLTVLHNLAQVLTEMSDQGQSRPVRITPEESAARAKARELMAERITEAMATEQEAVYELTGQVQLDDQLINPTYINAQHVRVAQVVSWGGVPNESMHPINETARGIHEAFIRSIGGRTKEARVAYKRAEQKYYGGIRVHGQESRQELPIVGQPRMGSGLRVHRPQMPGQIAETRVLGTIADPARSVG